MRLPCAGREGASHHADATGNIAMSRFIIERYVYDALNARADLAAAATEARRQIARGMLRDIEVYFADHMDDVRDARARLGCREDADARAMLAFIDETLAAFNDAERVAREAIGRARGD